MVQRPRQFGGHLLLAPFVVFAVLPLAIHPSAVGAAWSFAQEATPCPAAEAPHGVDVCVDRGDGATYAEGESITVCVTVNILVIQVFPPPPPPLVRLTNTVDGMPPRVFFEEALASGQRCLDGEIVPPLGDEVIVAEVLGPDGSLIASDTVSYRSVAAGPDTGLDGLIMALRAAGATVEPAGSVSQPFFDVTGLLLRVNTAAVQVYAYPDEAAAAAAAERILPDGSGLGPPTPVRIAWIAPPHFYRIGQLIVLYVGDDPTILDLLGRVLGPQFAGR